MHYTKRFHILLRPNTQKQNTHNNTGPGVMSATPLWTTFALREVASRESCRWWRPLLLVLRATSGALAAGVRCTRPKRAVPAEDAERQAARWKGTAHRLAPVKRLSEPSGARRS